MEKGSVSFVRVGGQTTFQARVQKWAVACFGEAIAGDRGERACRFLEESVELAQACGLSKADALSLVNYVYSRPPGNVPQEVGGASLTLAALCAAHGLYLDAASEDELGRVWVKLKEIRAKQSVKPEHSPLPMGNEGVADLTAAAKFPPKDA